jgi:Domain of unknown function (DUF4281)
MELNTIFNLANLYVLPFWLIMIILPKWSITNKIMSSYLPFIPLAGLYIYLFFTGLDAESIELFSNPNLSLTDLAKLFSLEKFTLTGWVHFLVMDLFVGRYIYLDGQSKSVWTIHSLGLCLFAGPMGLLSHILTSFIQPKLMVKQSEIQPS